MRRGAALRLVFLVFIGWGSGTPFFRAPAFYAFALILPLERMISHVFPWALTYPQSPEFERHHPPSPTQKIENNENLRAPGRKTGHALVSRCYIR